MIVKISSQLLLLLILMTSPLRPLELSAQAPPRKYVAHRCPTPLTIDGKSVEKEWSLAAWSQPFIDIEGVKTPKYQTRMKMLWDEAYLYFLAEMEEPHVWGNLRQRDTVIFHNNDFEIFIDPDGDTHNYYEFEVNALNTVWDLLLTKPYRNSGIVLDNWDINGLKTAVSIDGSLNDPRDEDQGWSVEIAIPWPVLLEASGSGNIPRDQFWRINFSRVNWDHELVDGQYRRKKDGAGKLLPEYNWVWSPQYKIAMHRPEYWGYVFFSSDSDKTLADFAIPKDEHIKWHLYDLYKELRTRLSQGKRIRKPRLRKQRVLGKNIRTKLKTTDIGWYLQAKSPFSQKKLTVDQSGLFKSID